MITYDGYENDIELDPKWYLILSIMDKKEKRNTKEYYEKHDSLDELIMSACEEDLED